MSTERKSNGMEHAARQTPLCDVWEARDGVHVVADMPGVEPQSVEVTVERGLLAIRGKAELTRPSSSAQGAPRTHAVQYERGFQLGDTADPDEIQATCKDGVVRVLIPRREPKQRKIAVNAG
jgi:HSP20 family protein